MKTMTDTHDDDQSWTIKRGPGSGQNDEIQTHRHPDKINGGWADSDELSVKHDGYPVVVMESGVDDDGFAQYHEQREVIGPAKTWEEAKAMVADRLGDTQQITEAGLSGLQDGGMGQVDYYAVEVVVPAA